MNEQVLEEAARWCARLSAPDCTERERASFALWKLSDAAHARAFAAAESLSGRLFVGAGTDPQLREMAERAYAQLAPAAQSAGRAEPIAAGGGSRWRAMLPIALAASLVLAFLGVLMMQQAPRIVSPSMQTIAYSTSSEPRSVTLADGSIVHLDIASRIDVRMAGRGREIRLVDGRALFEVAHDAARAFTVSANSGRVVALGTKFQVERDEGQVVVTLTEGSVAVDDSSAPSRHETLRPGEQLSFGTGTSAWIKRNVDSQLTTSWSRGRHIFRGTPLDEAIAEVNRYAAEKVRLADPRLASLRVGGNFIMGDSKMVVAAFEAALPVRAVESGGNEILLFPTGEPGALDSPR